MKQISTDRWELNNTLYHQRRKTNDKEIIQIVPDAPKNMLMTICS